MRILLFVVIWMVVFLDVPGIPHSWFSSQGHHLASLSAIVSFVGAALLSAWVTGFFADDDYPSHADEDLSKTACNQDTGAERGNDLLRR